MLLLLSDQIEAQAGNMPAVTVLFETDPGVWADISADVIGGDIVRGKQRELDRYQTGSATLVLRNDDRRYDPNHTGSPYNGSIKPRRRMRIQATWDGVTYDEFFGSVDRWIPDYRGPRTADVGVQLSDGFKDLARANLASSSYAQEVLADEPVAWWRLGEPESTGTAYDSIGTRHLTVSEAVTFGSAGMVSRDANTSVAIPYEIADSFQTDPISAVTGALTGWPLSIECIFKAPTRDENTRVGLFSQRASDDTGVAVFLNIPAGTVVDPTQTDVWFVAGGAGDSIHTVATGWDDNEEHHIVCTWDTDTSATMWIDGVLVPNEGPGPDDSTIDGPGVFAGTQTTVIGQLIEFSGAAGTGTAVTIAEVAVYDHVLSAARVAAHVEARVTPWNNDLPGERIGRVLDAIDWPDELRDLDTGTATLQPATLGQSALEHAQTAAASDFGLLYVTKDGRVRFEDRSNLVNQTSVATFTDEHGADPAIITLTPEYGDDLIRNDVTISRLEGKAQNVRDAASIAEYGRISYSQDGLYHDSDTQSLGAAEFIVSEYAEPQQRISGLTIYPKKTPATLWPAVLSLELADKVTVAHTPQGVGDEIEQASTVEGISHRFGPDEWETSLNVSPSFGSGDGDDCVLELDTGPCGLDDARLWF